MYDMVTFYSYLAIVPIWSSSFFTAYIHGPDASVSGLSETTVTLSWHRNCSVSPNVSYSVTYNGTAHCGEIIPPNSTEDLSGSYTVMGLEEFTGYTFILNSSNGDIATAQAYTEPAGRTCQDSTVCYHMCSACHSYSSSPKVTLSAIFRWSFRSRYGPFTVYYTIF